MSVLRLVLEVVLIAGGVLVALVAAYLLLLAMAALLARRGARDRGDVTRPEPRLAVVVPAHDEAELVARCVRSLLAQSYPRDRYQVIVVADNCEDETAAEARSAGAWVLVRDEPGLRGKGRALRWAMDRLLSGPHPPQAIVVVDADSVAEPAFLEALVGPYERGADCVQGESLLIEDGSSQSALRAAAFLLVNRVRPLGRKVLGLPGTLAGNGMLFAAELLRWYPWNAYTSTEDIEYAVTLRTAGVRPAFAAGAVLHSFGAPSAQAAESQELRWDGGQLHLVRTRVPGLVASAVRTRRAGLLDVAFELSVPPLGLLTAVAALGLAVSGVLVAADQVAAATVVPWLAGLAAIPLYVLVGLVAGRAPASAYRSLARAPLLVWRKARRVVRLARFEPESWVRTDRQGVRELD
jgi:cellulose synthase/poly-beta-1,6-N-acetylglucosamine synthase-like glycosyltransferase